MSDGEEWTTLRGLAEAANRVCGAMVNGEACDTDDLHLVWDWARTVMAMPSSPSTVMLPLLDAPTESPPRGIQLTVPCGHAMTLPWWMDTL